MGVPPPNRPRVHRQHGRLKDVLVLWKGEEMTPDEAYYLDVILRLVRQNCRDGDHLFSGFIAVHAEAMALLGKKGLIKITNDDQGRVVEGEVL